MYEFLTHLTWGFLVCTVAPLGGKAMALVTLACGLVFDNWALCGFSVLLYLMRHDINTELKYFSRNR